MRIKITHVLLLLLALSATACGSSNGTATPATPPSVLVVHAADPVSIVTDVSTKLAAFGVFTTVVEFDAIVATPDLATLQMYDAVMVMGDEDFFSSSALGDVLADYVDAGGGVVLTMFSVGPSGTNTPQGRFASANYFAMSGATGNLGDAYRSLVAVQAAHPILQGVSSFGGASNSFAPTGATPVAGATLIATWDDMVATPLIVTRQVGAVSARRADLGFYPPTQDTGRTDFIDPATDSMLIVANALRWVAGDL